MIVELDYDEKAMHSDDPDAIKWFYEDILKENGELILHSNKTGDTVGEIKVLEIKGE
jgi:hypothetical protein